MNASAAIVGHATLVADRWRKRGASSERVNRYLGRVDAIRTRVAARAGEPLPTLYVREGSGYHAELTTWAGNVVGKVEIRGTARGFHGVKLYCYRAVIEGRAYHGRGLGPGMYVNMRPGKAGK